MPTENTSYFKDGVDFYKGGPNGEHVLREDVSKAFGVSISDTFSIPNGLVTEDILLEAMEERTRNKTIYIRRGNHFFLAETDSSSAVPIKMVADYFREQKGVIASHHANTFSEASVENASRHFKLNDKY